MHAFGPFTWLLLGVFVVSIVQSSKGAGAPGAYTGWI